jgi:PRC-barrel domain
MLQSVHGLLELPVRARDGKVGKATDFYFGADDWKIRGIVVNTGGWLPHYILLPSAVFSAPEVSTHALKISRTREEVREKADTETTETLFGIQSEPDRKHHGKAAWDRTADAHGAPLSAREITGYQVEAEDGPAGSLHDLVFDDSDWTVQYFVVDMKDVRMPNLKVLVPPSWVIECSWADSKVYLKVGHEAVRASQKYDESSHGHLERTVRADR